MKYFFIILVFISCNTVENKNSKRSSYQEKHRSQIHFSPNANWMNDPNGMVYHNGVYHLFFQYYPDSTVWGPMHWGHATSKDLVHWNEEPIALYPDSLGYIFSGSAVVDKDNTSGFGKNGQPPLVSIFTYHNTAGEKAGRTNYQTQGIAYSLDEGTTWTKYEKNPALHNPGIKDFRDPKVMWYEPVGKWIMTLATLDRITFYSSADLKNWTKESEFGQNLGAHGGVWECPDLFPINHNGDSAWVLFVSINPGGPNGGSATQYFIGQFDGKNFTTNQSDTRWLDYGPDNYAGVIWSNVGERKLFLGLDEQLAIRNVSTHPSMAQCDDGAPGLRDAKTGRKVYDEFHASQGIDSLNEKGTVLNNIVVSNFDLTAKTGEMKGPARLRFNSDKIENFVITFSNEQAEQVVLGYDRTANNYFIDRTKSGTIDFEKSFGAKYFAPRIARHDAMDLELIIDNASVEVFADAGLTAMTAIFFPSSPYTRIAIESKSGLRINSLEFNSMKSVWK